MSRATTLLGRWPLAFAGVLVLALGPVAAARPDPPTADSHGDPLPDGALFRLGSLRYRHPDFINSSALSPDGKLLATAGPDHVAVMDLSTGKRVRFFRDCGTPRRVSDAQVSFSPDGTKLTHLCAADVSARIWDLRTGKLVGEIGRKPVNVIGGRGKIGKMIRIGMDLPTDPAQKLQYTSDGKDLLVLGITRIATYDAQTAERRQVAFPTDPPTACSPDGKRFACLYNYRGARSVSVCATDSGREETRFPYPVADGADWHARMAFTPNGKALVAVEYQKLVVNVWSLEYPDHRLFRPPLAGLGLTEPPVCCVLRVSPDGRELAAGTRAGDILRISLVNGKAQPPLKGHRLAVTGLHYSPDGKELVSTSADATVRRWDLTRGEERPLPDGYVGMVSTALAPDGKLLAVGDFAGRVDLYDPRTGQRTRTMRASGPAVHRLAFAPDGKTLALGCGDGVVRFIESEGGAETAAYSLPGDRKSTPGKEMTGLAFSPDGGRMLTVSRHDGLRLWDLATRKSVWSAPVGDVSRAAFSPDGKCVVAGGWDARLTFRDAAKGDELRTVLVSPDPDHPQPTPPFVDALTFSPDGKVLATAHHDGLLRLWDPSGGRELKRLRGHVGEVWAARFSPDGKWLVSGGSDGTVRIWEVLTGREVRKMTGHDCWVREALFAADGRSVLTSGGVEALAWDIRPPGARWVDPEALWARLRSPDAGDAYGAVWYLAARGQVAAAFLRERILPVRPVDEPGVATWVAALDSTRYAVREEATRALADRGDAVMPALRAALAEQVSPEARRRLEYLVNALHREPTPDELRRARAVQALEMAATPEARAVLQAWASGTAGAALTEDARAALDRLRRYGS